VIPASLTGLVLPFCTFLKEDKKNCILNVASTLSVIHENYYNFSMERNAVFMDDYLDQISSQME
jgi:hypothetical protein